MKWHEREATGDEGEELEMTAESQPNRHIFHNSVRFAMETTKQDLKFSMNESEHVKYKDDGEQAKQIKFSGSHLERTEIFLSNYFTLLKAFFRLFFSNQLCFGELILF